MKIEIEKVSHQDIDHFVQLIRVFEDVFEMSNFIMPDQEHLNKLLKKPNFVCFIAKAEGKVLGGLTAYVMDQYYSTRPLAYIYDLAVLKEYQRKGIGKALIKYFTGYCKENGFEEVFVQADRVDAYALDFYRATKPTNEEDVVHFYYTL